MKALLIMIAASLALCAMFALLWWKVEGFETAPETTNEKAIEALRQWRLCLQSTNIKDKQEACREAVERIKRLTNKTNDWNGVHQDTEAHVVNAAHTIEILTGNTPSIEPGLQNICVVQGLPINRSEKRLLDISAFRENAGTGTAAGTAADTAADESDYPLEQTGTNNQQPIVSTTSNAADGNASTETTGASTTNQNNDTPPSAGATSDTSPGTEVTSAGTNASTPIIPSATTDAASASAIVPATLVEITSDSTVATDIVTVS